MKAAIRRNTDLIQLQAFLVRARPDRMPTRRRPDITVMSIIAYATVKRPHGDYIEGHRNRMRWRTSKGPRRHRSNRFGRYGGR